jgi:hypothetical protein
MNLLTQRYKNNLFFVLLPPQRGKVVPQDRMGASR